MKQVTIYTDGACSGNPGPGGWGAVLMFGSHRKEIYGYAPLSTNQKMELAAAIEGLTLLKEPCAVDLYSDSAYLINGFTKGWVANWCKNGWVNSKKNPVENQDLWKALLVLSTQHKITWHKVAGHTDNVENNRCDFLARLAIKEQGGGSF